MGQPLTSVFVEGEDVAANLLDRTLQATEKSPVKVVKSQNPQPPSLGGIFEMKPTEMAFNFLNSIFNIGQKFLKVIIFIFFTLQRIIY